MAQDLHGAAGSGVSGQPGDLAFDNSASNRMGGNSGTPGYGGIALVANGGGILNGMSSFTVQGWYNGASTPGNYARLLDVNATGASSLGVWFQVDGGVTKLQLTTRINDTQQIFYSTDASMLQANTWTFFAFTYDGTTGNVSLYGGSATDSVSLIASGELLAGTLSTATNQSLAIGNSVSNENLRPFDGLLDNFRIWGELAGAGGALTKAQLEAVRLADLGYSQIPEPSAFALLAGFGALGMAATRRGGARRR